MQGFPPTLAIAAVLIVAGAPADAQTRVRTEVVRPQTQIVQPQTQAVQPQTQVAQPQTQVVQPQTQVVPPQTKVAQPPTEVVTPHNASPAFNRANNPSDVVVTGTLPPPDRPIEVITDLSKLPPAVAHMRERILAAARTGELDAVVAVMASNQTMPIFSLSGERDPVVYWRRDYPESGGVEVLAILTDILEAGFVHVDAGTPEEMYVWPYFARMPLHTLKPEQKVALLRIVTGGDYKSMRDAGTYNFFRVGIGQDGKWRFFVTGD